MRNRLVPTTRIQAAFTQTVNRIDRQMQALQLKGHKPPAYMAGFRNGLELARHTLMQKKGEAAFKYQDSLSLDHSVQGVGFNDEQAKALIVEKILVEARDHVERCEKGEAYNIAPLRQALRDLDAYAPGAGAETLEGDVSAPAPSGEQEATNGNG